MLELTLDNIEDKYRDKINEYYKQWRRKANMSIIPEVLSMDDIGKVLDIMIKRGFTFLAAYYNYKNPGIKMILIDDISLPYKFMECSVSNKKLNNKIRGLNIGLLNVVTLNNKYKLLDGYAIYTLFKNNNELYVPCEFKERVKVYSTTYDCERKEIRSLLHKQCNGKCYICGRQTILTDGEIKRGLDATIDHIVPINQGGTSDIDNCAICCHTCNTLKANNILTDDLKKHIRNTVLNKGK